MTFTVAVVGRPNVGKSTLFNRLVGRRLAIVDDTPGVTRDRREGEARLGPLRFTVIDTAGLAEADLQLLRQGHTRRGSMGFGCGNGRSPPPVPGSTVRGATGSPRRTMVSGPPGVRARMPSGPQ